MLFPKIPPVGENDSGTVRADAQNEAVHDGRKYTAMNPDQTKMRTIFLVVAIALLAAAA